MNHIASDLLGPHSYNRSSSKWSCASNVPKPAYQLRRKINPITYPTHHQPPSPWHFQIALVWTDTAHYWSVYSSALQTGSVHYLLFLPQAQSLSFFLNFYFFLLKFIFWAEGSLQKLSKVFCSLRLSRSTKSHLSQQQKTFQQLKPDIFTEQVKSSQDPGDSIKSYISRQKRIQIAEVIFTEQVKSSQGPGLNIKPGAICTQQLKLQWPGSMITSPPP